MSRWEPNARGRLQQAAMELYFERGFEQTTVAEIAKRAGLTERTFFRYFADKREVLFWGSGALQELLVNAVADAPAGTSPMGAVTAALEAAATVFSQERHEGSRQRHSIISANAELQERELIKAVSLISAMAEALRLRGVAELTARLAAEAGLAVFRVTFERWVAPANRQDFSELVQESLAELKAVTAAE